MKNKYIVLAIGLIFALSGTYALLKDDASKSLESDSVSLPVKVESKQEVSEEAEIDASAEEVTHSDEKNHDDLEDYRILVGLVDTYLGEIRSNNNPDAIELMRLVEVKKTDYITLLNSISNVKSKENVTKISDLNNLRDDLLELIDQLTMLKE